MQQSIKALTAVAHAHLRQFTQALAQDPIIPPVWLISEASALYVDHLAGPASRDAVGVDEVVNRMATLHRL